MTSPSSDDEESEDGKGLLFDVGWDLLLLGISAAFDGHERLGYCEVDSVLVFVSSFACFWIDGVLLENDQVNEGRVDDRTCSFRRKALLVEPILSLSLSVCDKDCKDSAAFLLSSADESFDCRFRDEKDVVGDVFAGDVLVPEGWVISRELSVLTLLFDDHSFVIAFMLLSPLFCRLFRLLASSSSEERDKSYVFALEWNFAFIFFVFGNEEVSHCVILL